MNTSFGVRANTCPLCQSAETLALLQRSHVPVLLNKRCLLPTEAQSIGRGSIDLYACLSCGFLFNAAFEPHLVVYDLQYENTQAYAPSFSLYLDQLAQMLVEQHSIRHCRIIEIGCGDGSFLERLVQRGDNLAWGFDPSYRGPATLCDGRLQFFAESYDESFKEIAADVVICRHVLEHLAHPLDFLRLLHRNVSHAQETRFFFETPSVEWILQTNAFWDI